jgi:hypothetical protein
MLFRKKSYTGPRDDRLRALLLFNERDYLAFHEDVATAVRRREFASGFDHYRTAGIFENRFPGYDGFDPHEYLEINTDVAASLKDQNVDLEVGAREHFSRAGFSEGRRWRKDMA